MHQFSKRFSAKLIAPAPLGSSNILHFSRSRIIFPDGIQTEYLDGGIKHNSKYTLDTSDMDSLVWDEKYSIVLNDGKRFRLLIDKENEKKLKWVHRLYWYQKEPLAVIAIGISIASVVVAIIALAIKG